MNKNRKIKHVTIKIHNEIQTDFWRSLRVTHSILVTRNTQHLT